MGEPDPTEWKQQVMESLYNMQQKALLCDATIRCQGNDCCIHAHACVLASVSPVFREAIGSCDDKIKHQEIILDGHDYSMDTWNLIMQFMYLGEFQGVLQPSKCKMINELAEKLSIQPMMKWFCADEVQNNHSIDDEDSETQHCQQACKINENFIVRNRRKFQCSQCQLKFTREKALSKHVAMHNATFSCSESECHKKFSNSRSLEMHKRVVHTGKELACSECSFKTINQMRLFAHKNHQHKVYNCTHCNFTTKVKASLMKHLKFSHDLKKLFSCPKCEYSTNVHGALKNHEAVHNDNRLYSCPDCEKLYKRKTDLKKHIHTHPKYTPYICEQCNKRFSRQIMLDNHNRTYHGKEALKCKQCEAPFTTSSQLYRHVRIVHKGLPIGTKQLSCDYCSAILKSYSQRKRHMMAHRNEKPFKCDGCPRSFITKHDLNIHSIIHTGEKPFLCSVCSFASNRLSNLRVHEKKHLSKTIHVCSDCDPPRYFNSAAAINNHNLKNHMAGDVTTIEIGLDELNEQLHRTGTVITKKDVILELQDFQNYELTGILDSNEVMIPIKENITSVHVPNNEPIKQNLL